MNGTTQTKREQADAVVGSAFEAHLAESRWPKLADRRVDALVKTEGEVTALAYEKGLNPRTLRSAFYRLQDRVLDSGSFAKTTAGHVGAVAPQPETMTLPIEQVRPDDEVWTSGHRYLVRENVFDPYGNTGDQPRHVLVCYDPAGREPFAGYMTIGRTVGLHVTITKREVR